MANEIKYTIVNHITTLSTSAKNWTKEVNLISWNGGAPKYDIRDWAPEHEKMGKGITLTGEEAEALVKALSGKAPQEEAPEEPKTKAPEEPKEEPEEDNPLEDDDVKAAIARAKKLAGLA